LQHNNIFYSRHIFCKKNQKWRGWDSNPRTPKGRDHSSRIFLLFLSVLREEMVSWILDLESCAFDQASLPLRLPVLPVKPYFIVAASEIGLNFAWCQYNMLMPKPEIVSRLCIKCHSKTVHEVREKTVAGIKLVCTDCGHSIIVATM
jgi:DNA-directed RNA polymerase subunit RPC12/RpoP